uniref:Uncharacterized protein n=1 Tax=Salix viminalis TaxID=40686 RepID=A0A6N2MMB1_SALVM
MNRRDPLSDKIQISLQNLSTNQSTCSIFKVPRVLRSVNDRAYEPEILSIGPYHRGKDDLKMMEEHKMHYLKMFLQRRPENSLTSYVAAMRGLEERARRYYHQPVSLEKDAFVEMLLLDGCFIVELLCKIATPGLQQGDPVTGNILVLSTISYDMLLVKSTSILFFWSCFLWQCRTKGPLVLSLIRHQVSSNGCSRLEARKKKYNFIPRMQASSRLVVDTTESLFRNLIAYEQCSQGHEPQYVTDYMTLMDCLINTRECAALRIIENGLGDDEMVCMLFNNLGTNVMISDRDRFYYAQVFERVEMHCARRRNVWMAKLRRNYFNSPWSLISFIAALSLLLLTFLQTVFTVMSTFK